MRIFCKFNAIISQNMYVWNFFARYKKYGLIDAIRAKKYIDNTIPYNPFAISLIYSIYINRKIFIIANNTNEKYCRFAIDQLSNEDSCIDFDIVKDPKIEDGDILISDSLLDMWNYRRLDEKSFISNSISCFIFYLIGSGKKNIKNCFFYGVFSIPFSFSVIMSVLFLFSPYIVIGNLNTINTSFSISQIFSSILLCSMAKLLRELVEAPNEMLEYTNNNEILCSSTFVFGRSSMIVGIIYFIIGCSVFLFCFIKNPYPSICSLLISIIYYKSYFLKNIVKIPLFLIVGIFITIISQPRVINFF